MSLIKNENIMHRVNRDRDMGEFDLIRIVKFNCIDPDGTPEDNYRDTTINLDKVIWEDMEKPDVITVTVEPGDTLN